MIADRFRYEVLQQKIKEALREFDFSGLGLEYEISLREEPDIEIEIDFHASSELYYDIIEFSLEWTPGDDDEVLRWVLDKSQKITERRKQEIMS